MSRTASLVQAPDTEAAVGSELGESICKELSDYHARRKLGAHKASAVRCCAIQALLRRGGVCKVSASPARHLISVSCRSSTKDAGAALALMSCAGALRRAHCYVFGS